MGNFSFNFKAMALFSLHFSFVLQVSNVILISDLLFMTCFTLRKTLGFFFLYSYSTPDLISQISLPESGKERKISLDDTLLASRREIKMHKE